MEYFKECYEKSKFKSVYVLMADDGTVKIGVSKDVIARISALEGSAGKKIIEHYETDKCSNPFIIESLAHKQFSKYRTHGEWYLTDYKNVKIFITQLFDNIAKYDKLDYKTHNEGINNLMDKMLSLNINHKTVYECNCENTIRNFRSIISCINNKIKRQEPIIISINSDCAATNRESCSIELNDLIFTKYMSIGTYLNFSNDDSISFLYGIFELNIDVRKIFNITEYGCTDNFFKIPTNKIYNIYLLDNQIISIGFI